MTAKIFDHASTKAEEVEALTRFAARFNSQSYLYNFFTPDLLNWIHDAVKADMLPDLMNYVKSAEAAAYEQRNQCQAAQQAVKNLQAQNDSLTELVRAGEERLKASGERVKGWSESAEYWAEETHKEAAKVKELTDEAERLKAELVTLKAKLYDYQNK